MAIIYSLPGVEVTIVCNKTQLIEHPNNEDNTRLDWKQKTISKYIESVSDSEFFIQLRVGPAYKFVSGCLNFSVILDGDEEGNDGYICHPDDFVNGTWEEEADGTEIPTDDGRSLRKYKFASLQTTEDCDDDMSQEEKDEVGMIGLIEVRVHHAHIGKSTTPELKEFKLSRESIPEKLLKGEAISHCTTYADETKVSSPSIFQTASLVNGWDAPVGIFRFKYRSREDLQKQCIIQRSSSPEQPTSLSRSFDSFTAKERRQWARIKFDEMHLLSTLASGQSMYSPLFDDLDENEVSLLARRKHAEIMGTKIEPDPIIKREAGRDTGGYIWETPGPKSRPYNQVAMENGKMAVDLTEDSSDDGGEEDDDVIEVFSPTAFTVFTASRSTDIDEMVEAKQSSTTDVYVMETTIPNSCSPVVPQDMAAAASMGESITVAAAARVLATGTDVMKIIAPQVSQERVVLGGHPVDINADIQDVHVAKRRKVGDIGHSDVKMKEPLLLPSIMA